MPHDAFVLEQACDLPRSVARHRLRIEIVEGGAEGLALAQDGDPGKSCLESFKHQLLKQSAGVGLRHAPLLVVIGDIERVRSRPWAALRFPLAHVAAAGADVSRRAQAGM